MSSENLALLSMRNKFKEQLRTIKVTEDFGGSFLKKYLYKYCIGKNFTVVFRLTGQWNGGYNANIQIKNAGTSIIYNWYLRADGLDDYVENYIGTSSTYCRLRERYGIKMELKEEFNAIYAPALAEKGFTYNKRYDMHVKIVDGELFQFIKYTKKQWYRNGYKQFIVVGGVVSIYTYSLQKKDLVNCGTTPFGYARNLFQVRNIPQDYAYNDENIIEVIESSLEHTMRYIVPVLERVTDLNTYIEFCKIMEIGALKCADKGAACSSDALVLIQTENHDDFEDFFNESLECTMKEREDLTGIERENFYRQQYDLLYRGIIELIPKARDKVYENPELYAEVQEELKRRKEANLNILKRNAVIVE